MAGRPFVDISHSFLLCFVCRDTFLQNNSKKRNHRRKFFVHRNWLKVRSEVIFQMIRLFTFHSHLLSTLQIMINNILLYLDEKYVQKNINTNISHMNRDMLSRQAIEHVSISQNVPLWLYWYYAIHVNHFIFDHFNSIRRQRIEIEKKVQDFHIIWWFRVQCWHCYQLRILCKLHLVYFANEIFKWHALQNAKEMKKTTTNTTKMAAMCKNEPYINQIQVILGGSYGKMHRLKTEKIAVSKS